MIQGKIWGKTSCIFNGNNVEIHRIEVKAGGFCSKHIHENKYNLFYLESGKLKVIIFRDEESDSTLLTQGMSSLVNPGEVHMFEAIEDTIAYEIYWVTLNLSDIKRYEKGGIKQIEE